MNVGDLLLAVVTKIHGFIAMKHLKEYDLGALSGPDCIERHNEFGMLIRGIGTQQ